MDKDQKSYIGRCTTCGAEVAASSEDKAREKMEPHADQLGHAYAVIEEGHDPLEYTLYCPNPDCPREKGGRYFSLKYDEATDTLTFTCLDCNVNVEFREVKEEIAEGIHS